MEYPDISELQVDQRFILGGDIYFVLSVGYDDSYEVYRITARGTDAIHNVELRIPARTPFLILC